MTDALEQRARSAKFYSVDDVITFARSERVRALREAADEMKKDGYGDEDVYGWLYGCADAEEGKVSDE